MHFPHLLWPPLPLLWLLLLLLLLPVACAWLLLVLGGSVVLWLRKTLAGSLTRSAAGSGWSAMCTKAALRVTRWSSREKSPRRRARPTKKSATSRRQNTHAQDATSSKKPNRAQVMPTHG